MDVLFASHLRRKLEAWVDEVDLDGWVMNWHKGGCIVRGALA